MTQTFGTKAETLALLNARGFSVPPLLYFEVRQWEQTPRQVLDAILERFPDKTLAIRSSALMEDSPTASMAGTFLSILNVQCHCDSLTKALNNVTDRLCTPEDQILVQPMLENVLTSGVIMTRVLDDGSPYYVFNYDDVSGRTDTVTGGTTATKSVYVYKGVQDADFDSPRLREALRLARALENIFKDTPLDIEFAIDSSERAWLLQVRPICTAHHWNKRAAASVSSQILHLETFIRKGMRPRPGFFGRRTIYGVMPDWNPAEIIGLVPRPLAFSLYRAIITHEVWNVARTRMGYHPLPPTDLMVSVAGRPYIDVRASFNSFLPADLPSNLAEKLVNQWLDRLEAHPEFHDKIEFDIVPTVLTFDAQRIQDERYPHLLTEKENTVYFGALRHLTNTALTPQGSLHWAMSELKKLDTAPLPSLECDHDDLAVLLPALLEDCRRHGTLPFAVAARHAFMAESLLLSAIRCKAFSSERLQEFKQSIVTISGQMSTDFAIACKESTCRAQFLKKYGHLRPGTYDILSPSYAQRTHLFTVDMDITANIPPHRPFILTRDEHDKLSTLLHNTGLTSTPEALLDYARTAIAGREYAKFIFTRHLSHILELLAAWGLGIKLNRAQVAMIPVEAVLKTLFTPLSVEPRTHFLSIIRKQRHLHDLASSFKLSQIIRSTRDVYIAPIYRAAPNFITSRRIEAPVVRLSAAEERNDLTGKLVCIESADPGYDWIFTRGVAGLITLFGGVNSHMAIRCSEYALPAAIGCGSLLFEQATAATVCILDCGEKTLCPLGNTMQLL